MIWQIILAIDDSLSMRENRSGQLACEALLVLNKALARLQVGQVTMRPVTISSSQPQSIDSETRALDSLSPRPRFVIRQLCLPTLALADMRACAVAEYDLPVLLLLLLLLVLGGSGVQVAVVRFGEEPTLLQPFQRPYTAGARR